MIEVQAMLQADRPFDPWRAPAPGPLMDAAVRAIAQIESHEQRTRRRKAAGKRVFERTVQALIADAAYRHLEHPGAWVYLSLSSRVLGAGPARYRPVALNTKLPETVAALAALGWLEFELGGKNASYFGFVNEETGKHLSEVLGMQRSRVRAGPALLPICEHLIPSTFVHTQAERRESIVMRGPVAKGRIDPKTRSPRVVETVEDIDYSETAETERLREQLRTINRFLGAADIAYTRPDGSSAEPHEVRPFLYRVFTKGTLASHGRLYTGFWQHLNDTERMARIRLDGEPVTVLDYRQSGPRILYAMAGVQPHWNDAYAIPGLDTERCRPLVKRAFNALLHAGKPMKNPPGDASAKMGNDELEQDNFRNELSALGLKWIDLRNRITDYHEPVASLLYSGNGGVGGRVTRIESDVLVDVLLACVERRLIALPVHDAVIVPARAREEVAGIMQACFRDRTGHSIQVKDSLSEALL